jgi:extradiol dioxygenase family protein
MSRFHLAFPVTDLAATRAFYGELLGCPEGRSADRWIDFDLRGYQISAHLVDAESHPAGHNPVDGDAIPVPHFGLILDPTAWRDLADRLVAAGADFVVPPRVRFSGRPGEQATMFVRDPSGNVLEFKSFEDTSAIFAR